MSQHSDYEPTSGFRHLTLLPQSAISTDSVIVYLHGIGERGSDLSLVTKYGLLSLLRSGLAAANCPVICPQLESNDNWNSDRIFTLLQAISKDIRKTALIGYSLGASGVFSTVSRFGPVCGLAVAVAGQAAYEAEISQAGVLLLAIQGELDSWANCNTFIQSINTRGGKAMSINLSGKGHYISEEAVLHHLCLSMLSNIGINISDAKNAG